MKSILKSLVQGLSLAGAFPLALLSGFGRAEATHVIGAECLALLPGLPGDYARIAWNRMTFDEYALGRRIQLGSFFAAPKATIGRGACIGSYYGLGRTSIGDRAQIALPVEILSGGWQRSRDTEGRIPGSERGRFETVAMGSGCWIGGGAIVTAEAGKRSTIRKGSADLASGMPGSVASRSPARVISSSSGDRGLS